MSPRIRAIEELLEQRAKRQFRVAVIFGIAIFFLVSAVSYSLYADYRQDSTLQTVSACALNPGGETCARGHANSVSLVTPDEACFILAQGGLRCNAPLPEAAELRRKLRRELPGIEIPYREQGRPEALDAPAGFIRPLVSP